MDVVGDGGEAANAGSSRDGDSSDKCGNSSCPPPSGAESGGGGTPVAWIENSMGEPGPPTERVPPPAFAAAAAPRDAAAPARGTPSATPPSPHDAEKEGGEE